MYAIVIYGQYGDFAVKHTIKWGFAIKHKICGKTDFCSKTIEWRCDREGIAITKTCDSDIASDEIVILHWGNALANRNMGI